MWKIYDSKMLLRAFHCLLHNLMSHNHGNDHQIMMQYGSLLNCELEEKAFCILTYTLLAKREPGVDPGILMIELYRHQVTKVSHQDNRPCKEGHSSQKPLQKPKSHISTLQKSGRLGAELTTDHLEPTKYTEKPKHGKLWQNTDSTGTSREP